MSKTIAVAGLVSASEGTDSSRDIADDSQLGRSAVQKHHV